MSNIKQQMRRLNLDRSRHSGNKLARGAAVMKAIRSFWNDAAHLRSCNEHACHAAIFSSADTRRIISQSRATITQSRANFHRVNSHCRAKSRGRKQHFIVFQPWSSRKPFRPCIKNETLWDADFLQHGSYHVPCTSLLLLCGDFRIWIGWHVSVGIHVYAFYNNVGSMTLHLWQ